MGSWQGGLGGGGGGLKIGGKAHGAGAIRGGENDGETAWELKDIETDDEYEGKTCPVEIPE